MLSLALLTFVVAFFRVVSTSSPQAPAIQNAVVPISVVSVQWDPNEQLVSFTLRNDTDKTITAWDVQIRSGPNSSGASSGHGVDSYSSAAGVLPEGYHIPPRGTVVKTARLGSLPDGSTAVEITPLAAIFDDKSIAGDSRFADDVFARRARDRDAWQEVLAILEQARNTDGPGEEVLRLALSRVDDSLRRHGKDFVITTTRTNLRLALEDVQKGRDSPGPRLDALADQARRSVAAAVAHSRQ